MTTTNGGKKKQIRKQFHAHTTYGMMRETEKKTKRTCREKGNLIDCPYIYVICICID